MRDDAPLLLNNEGFALAHLGRLTEAQKFWERSLRAKTISVFSRMQTEVWQRFEPASTPKASRTTRQQSRDYMLRTANSVNIAKLYYAREAALAGLPDAPTLVKEARSISRKPVLKAHERIVEEAENALKAALRGRSFWQNDDRDP